MNVKGPPTFSVTPPAAAAANLAGLPTADIGKALRTGAVTSRELVEQTLAQIRKLNPRLNCFVSVDEVGAQSAAQILDDEMRAGVDRGPLHGIPVAIKDIIDVAGQVTTSGSALFQYRVGKADAAAVSRLRAAGAVMVGKTVLHEFAYGITGDRSVHGPSRNPHNPTRMSGGSSGGSAVAVAAGIVPIALGTDTAGSVRVPAALCGVVGFKPAFGAISTKGVYPLASSLDHVGLFAQSVAIAELAYAVLADPGPTLDDADQDLHLGWVVPSVFSPIEATIETELLGVLARCGFEPPAFTIEDALDLFAILTGIQSYEAYLAHADDLRTAAARIDDEVRQRLEAGASISASTYHSALQSRDRFRLKILALFETYDLLAMPTVPTVAPPIGERFPKIAGQTVEVRSALLSLTSPWNLSGMPALSMPAGAIGGLPFGLQLICPPGRESTLFALAARIERITAPGLGAI